MSEEVENYIAPVEDAEEVVFHLEDSPEDTEQHSDPIADRLAEIEARNRALEAKLLAVETQRNNYLTPVQHFNQPQSYSNPFQDPQQRQLLAQNLEDSFVKKGIGETLLGLVEASQRLANQAANERLMPAVVATVKGAISSYKASAGMDAATKKEFDSIVKSVPDSVLAQVNPTDIENYLEGVHTLAAGRAARAGAYTPQVERKAPTYLAGNASVGKGRSVTLPLNSEERELASQLKAMGLKDDVIHKTIQQNRGGGIPSVKDRV